MGQFFIGIVKLLTPWFKEWWKSRKMDDGSINALREIHVMFVLHLVIFTFFLLSVEHGVGIYVKHTRAAHQYTINEQMVQDLRKQNEYLSTNYTRLLDMLEAHAKNNPRVRDKVLSLPDIENMREGIREHDQQ